MSPIPARTNGADNAIAVQFEISKAPRFETIWLRPLRTFQAQSEPRPMQKISQKDSSQTSSGSPPIVGDCIGQKQE